MNKQMRTKPPMMAPMMSPRLLGLEPDCGSVDVVVFVLVSVPEDVAALVVDGDDRGWVVDDEFEADDEDCTSDEVFEVWDGIDVVDVVVVLFGELKVVVAAVVGLARRWSVTAVTPHAMYEKVWSTPNVKSAVEQNCSVLLFDEGRN
jgi:hypothetical protein